MCGVGRLRAVVVKAGPLGAAWSPRRRDRARRRPGWQRSSTPPAPATRWPAGFLGACAAAERDDEDYFVTALDAGLRCAATWRSRAFGTAGLDLRGPGRASRPPAPGRSWSGRGRR